MRVRGVKRIEDSWGNVRRLEPGQKLRARVLAKIREGRFRVTAAGQLFEAESDLPLEAGQRLTARVELSGSRLLLRIQDDDFGPGAPPAAEENPETIRRVLTALGLEPTSLDILEFQERLERYKAHTCLSGVDPDDVWILAILWARGMRGSAEAFALVSFYLRQLTFDHDQRDFKLPDPQEIWERFPGEAVALNSGSEEAKGEEVECLIPGFRDRKQAALRLLNHDPATLGRCSPMNRRHASEHLLLRRDGLHCVLRWTDNPASPLYILETAKSPGKIITRLAFHALTPELRLRRLEIWREGWYQYLQNQELEIEDQGWEEVTDQAELLAAFWRRPLSQQCLKTFA